MRTLILIFLVFFSCNYVEANGWSIKGGSYQLMMIDGIDGDSDAKARIIILHASSMDLSEPGNQICYLTDLVNPQLKTYNYSKQEGVIYCEKTTGSSLSGALYLERADKSFECVKNCSKKTPKLLRYESDPPENE